jgi:replicative superfamily II helicase
LIASNLRVVVVDEIHAFAGDDRGWHLLSVLQRITARPKLVLLVPTDAPDDSPPSVYTPSFSFAPHL